MVLVSLPFLDIMDSPHKRNLLFTIWMWSKWSKSSSSSQLPSSRRSDLRLLISDRWKSKIFYLDQVLFFT